MNHPDSLATMFEEINRRIRALETAPGLSWSSVDASTGGAFIIHDANNNPLLTLGNLPNGSVGIQIATPAGGHVLLSDVNGMAVPFFVTPFRPMNGLDTNGAIKVTSATYVDVYYTTLELLQSDAVRVRLQATCNGTDQGQVRIVNATNSNVTSPRTYTSAAEDQDWHWLHGGTPVLSGPWSLKVQARLTAGTGGIWVYPPDGGATWFRSTEMTPNATATGI